MQPDRGTGAGAGRRSPASAAAGGPLLLVWSGHGIADDDDLRLLAADSGSHLRAGLPSHEIARKAAESGASQILFIIDSCFIDACFIIIIIDACYAGQAARPVAQAAVSMMRGPATGDRQVWVGGCARLLPERGTGGAVVERCLPRGGAAPDERTRFTGRTSEVNTVAGRGAIRQPGIYVATGPPARASRRSSIGWSAWPTRRSGSGAWPTGTNGRTTSPAPVQCRRMCTPVG